MDLNHLIDGVLQWIGLVILITFHEFGHAWMAMKCGDNTARDEGRVSLNPLVHIDPIGTVVMPLLMFLLPGGASRFLLGWAKPVPVNISNLRNPRIDDIYVTLAGPWMNIVLGIILVGLARVGLAINSSEMMVYCLRLADFSLLLCFFNLIPIPPLDGSRILRVLVGMSYETYHQIAQYGFVLVIIAMQVRPVGEALGFLTNQSMRVTMQMFGF